MSKNEQADPTFTPVKIIIDIEDWKRLHPFWWFIPVTELQTDIKVFDMGLDGVGFIEGALVEIIQNSTVVKSGYTDAQGKYSTILGLGTYKIRISKTGYDTVEKTETLSYPTELMVNLPSAEVLEGDYSDWTEVSGSPLTFQLVQKMQDAWINDDKKKAVFAANIYYALVTLEPPSLDEEGTFAEPCWLANPENYNSISGSILGKYFIYIVSPPSAVKVYKDGTLVKTIAVTADGGAFISPKGQYILVVGIAPKKLHIYKGS